MANSDSHIYQLKTKDIAASIRTQTLTARSVLEHYLDRIDKFNPTLNAVIFRDDEKARQNADQIDARIKAGENLGPLAGVPMTIKDAFEVTGMTCDIGVPAFKGQLSTQSATVVSRLENAGALIIGKTNTPYLCSDWQSYNAIHGTTNNPWHIKHTPGGSSGGSAAALSAGMTPIEFGSDIGGSIRVPAHYCGLFGHKPSLDIIPTKGHVPPAHGAQRGSDMNVVGPLARSVEDLLLLLDLTAGPERPLASAFSLALQGPRAQTPTNLRIGLWADDPYCTVSNQFATEIENAAKALTKQGAKIIPIKPPFDLEEHTNLYRFLLNAAMSSGPRNQTLHTEWLRAKEQTAQYLKNWMALFEQIDVLFCPVSPTTALPHTQDKDFAGRRMRVDGNDRDYNDNAIWPGVATSCGLPSTVVPLGLATDGLPFGMQIIGPPFEDKTPLAVAAMLETIGYQQLIPPGFEG